MWGFISVADTVSVTDSGGGVCLSWSDTGLCACKICKYKCGVFGGGFVHHNKAKNQ